MMKKKTKNLNKENKMGDYPSIKVMDQLIQIDLEKENQKLKNEIVLCKKQLIEANQKNKLDEQTYKKIDELYNIKDELLSALVRAEEQLRYYNYNDSNLKERILTAIANAQKENRWH
jgi:hypothetical protein